DPLTGELRDYVGGKADLDQRLIRAIGDADRRFEEDHLRLMRAIRQAVELEFEIEPTTWRAIQKHAHQIAKVSVERVRDELNRILRSPHRVRGFDLLVESGLMAVILPEILDLQGCEQPPQFHPEGDVYVHTRLMLSHLEPDASLTLVLSVLLHDIAKPATRSWDETAGRARFNGHDALGAEMAETILRRLKYPNEVIHAVVDAVAVHMRFIHIQDLRVAKLKRFLARPNFEEELALHRVDCLGSNGRLENYEFVREKQEEFSQQPLVPPRLITGADLIARGWQPSAMFRDILEQVETLQLEGSLKDRDSALAWLDALPHAEPR
ncbi:MAG: CCA tRNA nucleotidyltransferase, partial [Verrucomicrobiales bacterium]|nr:CCA tRNA nucleotidyltransferase [Verrucomicrobiales bacterium]